MVFPKAPEIWHGITELFHVVSDYCFTAVKQILPRHSNWIIFQAINRLFISKGDD